MNRAEIADVLTCELSLASPPVALCATDTPPDGVETAGPAPSACTFWRRAEVSVMYAPAETHFGCAVGAMVMGFDLPPEVGEQLQSAVSAMSACGYVGEGEAARIAAMPGPRRGILYGPLARFPVAPDAALLWLRPEQAMLFGEAAGSVSWTATAPAPVLGRPACAAVPVALDSGKPTLSLGCAGMRTFTEIASDRLLGVIPGVRLERLARDLPLTVRANAAMRERYNASKVSFEADAVGA